MKSYGQTEIGVLVNGMMFRMVIMNSKLVAKLNIMNILKTAGSMTWSDLKVTKCLIPGELQQAGWCPCAMGEAGHWGGVAAPGRFSTAGTELSSDQAPLPLCCAIIPQGPCQYTK